MVEDIGSNTGLPIGRRTIWYVVNLAAMALVTWSSSRLWLFHLKPGDFHASGPGDGLYFFFLLLIPWTLFFLVNVALLFRRLFAAKAPGYPWNIAPQLLLTALWITLAIMIQRLSQVPEGVISMGS